MLKNTKSSYGVIAKGFHWLLFLMLTFMIVAGNCLASMPKGPEKFQAAGMHKSFGLVVLALILLRLVWRLVRCDHSAADGDQCHSSSLAHPDHGGHILLA